MNDKNLAPLDLIQTLDRVYPIGTIYQNASVSTNPSILFGFGTWVAWGSGRVPVGIDTSQTEFNTVEKTGGEKAHTLTTDEMPSHGHQIDLVVNPNTGSRYGNGYFASGGGNAAWANATVAIITNNSGSDGAHNNLQPYITCYMWKRTA